MIGRKIIVSFSLFFALLAGGCEDTDLNLALQAGADALKAVTLTHKQVALMAQKASNESDRQHHVAPTTHPQAQRLTRLAGQVDRFEGISFNFKVYLSDKVNAFAMADGTIRMYSGLMDMMNDDELKFVIGHEIGHVVKQHVQKKIRLAYAASAVRKGAASQRGVIGDLARSALGEFVQLLLNAQFSQEEERQADDFGLTYLKKKQGNPSAAVSALEKLATLGSSHSFLSSHPAPDIRAKRIRSQLLSVRSASEPDSFFQRLAQWVQSLMDRFL